MSTKQIKIGHKKIQPLGTGDVFQVISVKNSTAHLPGEELNKARVDELCGNSNWEVTIVALNEGGR